jgi:hypothetical protein
MASKYLSPQIAHLRTDRVEPIVRQHPHIAQLRHRRTLVATEATEAELPLPGHRKNVLAAKNVPTTLRA